MVPRPAVIALTILAFAVTPGCVVNDYLAQQGTVVFEAATVSANDAPDLSRNDIDDFRELKFLVKSVQIKPSDGTRPETFEGGYVVDLVKLGRDETPIKVGEEKVGAKAYERWGVHVEMQEAVLKNGTRVSVAVAPGGFHYSQYSGEDAVVVPIAKTLTYRFTFAVIYDTEEIPGGPDGQYFLRLREDSGPV